MVPCSARVTFRGVLLLNPRAPVSALYCNFSSLFFGWHLFGFWDKEALYSIVNQIKVLYGLCRITLSVPHQVYLIESKILMDAHIVSRLMLLFFPVHDFSCVES